MFLAGAAAVSEVVPVGEELAEDAVLHVEHWHVLVQRHLHRPPGQRLQQVQRRHCLRPEEVHCWG